MITSESHMVKNIFSLKDILLFTLKQIHFLLFNFFIFYCEYVFMRGYIGNGYAKSNLMTLQVETTREFVRILIR